MLQLKASQEKYPAVLKLFQISPWQWPYCLSSLLAYSLSVENGAATDLLFSMGFWVAQAWLNKLHLTTSAYSHRTNQCRNRALVLLFSWFILPVPVIIAVNNESSWGKKSKVDLSFVVVFNKQVLKTFTRYIGEPVWMDFRFFKPKISYREADCLNCVCRTTSRILGSSLEVIKLVRLHTPTVL